MRFATVCPVKRLYRVCLTVTLAGVVGCGDSPTTPSQPVIPGLTSIAVSGEDLLLIGRSRTFTATGNTGTPVAARWGGDNPDVATVTPGGHVTAVGTGTVTVFADANGVRGTMLVRALPNFGGEWDLIYRVVRCEATGDRLRLGDCENHIPVGAYLKLVQTRDSVSGRILMTDWVSFLFDTEELSGAVAADGVLSFVATAKSGDNALELQNVRIATSGTDRLTGTFEEVWSGGAYTGSVRYFCELQQATRVGR